MQERDDPSASYSNTLNEWVLSMNATTYSAAFAGIDSPGTALLEWQHAVLSLIAREEKAKRVLPTKYVGPRTSWLLEWDGACQRELAVHPGHTLFTEKMQGDMQDSECGGFCSRSKASYKPPSLALLRETR